MVRIGGTYKIKSGMSLDSKKFARKKIKIIRITYGINNRQIVTGIIEGTKKYAVVYTRDLEQQYIAINPKNAPEI